MHLKHIHSVIVFCGCFALFFTGEKISAHTEVTPAQAQTMIANIPGLIVVDVREYSEYCSTITTPPGNTGHIPGAILLPWNSGVLQAQYQQLPIDADILVVCRSGGRSHSASTFLDSKDYLHVYDMTGGMLAWTGDRVTCVDTDNDDINDDLDNCPTAYNPSQTDSDGDGLGNACENECPDLTGDGFVTEADISAFADSWLQTGPGLSGDFDGDGKVDLIDWAIIAVYWLAPCSEESPE